MGRTSRTFSDGRVMHMHHNLNAYFFYRLVRHCVTMARCFNKKTVIILVVIFVCVSLLSLSHRPLHSQLQESQVLPYSLWDDTHNYALDFWDVMNMSYVSSHISRPQIGRYVCKDILCSEFLNQSDLSRVDKCVHRLKTKESMLVEEFGPRLLPVCHFMDATSRSSVALISFPGSGNTWVRQLLEKAAGVCTGE